jgi:hypothetical protein
VPTQLWRSMFWLGILLSIEELIHRLVWTITLGIVFLRWYGLYKASHSSDAVNPDAERKDQKGDEIVEMHQV